MRRRRADDGTENGEDTSANDGLTEGLGLDRRSYLKVATGAAVAAASPLVGTASAATVDLGSEGLQDGDEIDAYLEEHFVSGNEVHIPAGEYRWNGGGLGGSYRNAALVGDGDVVFRIPDGLTQRTNVLGVGGETIVANITIRGVQGDGRLRVDARDPDASVLFHNVNLPDGGEDLNGAIGFFVGTEHVGTATFRDCVVVGFPNNGIYSSAPGKDGQGDGQVRIIGGLYRNNNIANVRVGSTNSVVREAVIVHDGAAPRYSSGARNQRGLWIRSGGTDLTLEDNDIVHTYGGANSPIMLQARGGGGGGVIQDTRIRNDNGDAAVYSSTGDWSGDNLHLTGDGDYSVPSNFTSICTGGSCTEATTSPRDPVALDGSDGGGDSGSGGDTGDGGNTGDGGDTGDGGSGSDDPTASEHQLEVVSVDGGPRFSYSFTTTGPISKVTNAGDRSAEGNDDIVDNGDGTYTATGVTGGGYGDSFYFDGDAESFSSDTASGDYRLILDNQEVTADELTGTGSDGSDPEVSGELLEIVSVDGGPKFSYTLRVEGSVSKATENGDNSAETNDSITSSDGVVTVSGVTGGGYGDAYDVQGTVVDFSTDTDPANRELYLDGTPVTAVELTRPNRIVFDAIDDTQGASYRFEVTGKVEKSQGLGVSETTETVDGSAVSGEVTDSADGFRFSGDVVALELDGAASVSIEDTD